MDNKTSLLLGLVGLFVGAIAVIVFNYFRNSRMTKKAESLLDKAQKDADKLKAAISNASFLNSNYLKDSLNFSKEEKKIA